MINCFSMSLWSSSVISAGTVILLCFANIGVISGIDFHMSQNAIFPLPEIDDVVLHLLRTWKLSIQLKSVALDAIQSHESE